MLRHLLARHSCCLALLVLSWLVGTAPAQTADDVTKWIERLSELDSLDLCKFEVKYYHGVK
jgi:hypothetical protein